MKIHNVNLMEITVEELKETDPFVRILVYNETTKQYSICNADSKCPGKVKVSKQLSLYPVSACYRFFLMPFGELPKK